jgi:group I intron endonuclease
MDGIIYMITNKTTLKAYVGQTREYGLRKGKKVKIGVSGRWNQHVWCAKNRYDSCPALSRAIRKYGSDDFIVEEIYRCDIDDLNDAEIYFIQLYDTHKYGYNCTIGGDWPQMCPEQRLVVNKKISETNKTRWKTRDRVATGKIISASTRKAMWRPETRQKLLSSLESTKKSSLPPNVYERKVRGVLVGYEVKIRILGVLHRGWFSSKKKPLEQNFNDAISYLEDIKRKNL